MICQACLQSATKIDEVDMRKEFNGHEVCQLKGVVNNISDYENQLTEYDSEQHEYEDEISELQGKIDTLEEELLEYKGTGDDNLHLIGLHDYPE